MNSDFQPPFNISPFTNGGNRITPATLNKFGYAINRMNNGVYAPRVKGPDTGPVLLTNPVITASLIAIDDQDTSGTGQLIDGVAVDNDETILLQNQDDPTENGLWITPSDGASDPSWVQVNSDPNFTLVWVSDGHVYWDTLWGLDDPDPDTLLWEPANCITRRFQITGISGDFVTCSPYDERGDVDDTIDVSIARPYLLQTSLTAWNGLTFAYSNDQTRVATRTSDAMTENQVVVPAYVVGDDIVAVRGFFTDVTDSGDDVLWADCNADARQWAKAAGP